MGSCLTNAIYRVVLNHSNIKGYDPQLTQAKLTGLYNLYLEGKFLSMMAVRGGKCIGGLILALHSEKGGILVLLSALSDEIRSGV